MCQYEESATQKNQQQCFERQTKSPECYLLYKSPTNEMECLDDCLFPFMPSAEEYDAETNRKTLGKGNWDVRHRSLAETEQEHIKEYLREANASIVSPQTYHLAGKLSQAGTHSTVQGLNSLPKSGSTEPRGAWQSQEPWSKQSMFPAPSGHSSRGEVKD